MKIISNILISILIIASTSGVCISKHYCSNHLVSVSFFSNANKCCKGDCPLCKNVNHAYKVKTKVVQSETTNFGINSSLTSVFNLSYLNTIILNTVSENPLVRIYPPPGKSTSTIYFSKLRL